MTIRWLTNPQTTGTRFGSLLPGVTSDVLGAAYHSQTSFGPGKWVFDPTSDAGGQGHPTSAEMEADYNGGTYGYPVATIWNTLGIRTTDPTTTPGTPGKSGTLYNIARVWVPGDGSYEDRCITGWRDVYAGVTQRMLTRMWHEPATSDWAGGTGREADYRLAWEKVVKFFRDTLPADRCPLFVWCPNGHIGHPGTEASYTQWWPGDANVDWVGIDAYSHLSNKMASYSGLQTWYDSFKPGSVLNPSRKPMMICEFGIDAATGAGASAGMPTRSEVFNELTGLLPASYPDIKALTYWVSKPGACDVDQEIGLADCPPGFLDAMRAWLDSPYMNPPDVPMVTVPQVLGLHVRRAKASITATGLVPAGPTSGVIVTQTPDAGASAPQGSTVTYWVRRG